jgi:UDP-N-acetylglucosamine--N-acetylmuramyl-(pentapeptide) pyrophosphoryl-undecaprenol N-acetylglucosamine transferase
VIAGGGTGGHVVPALAIGRALVARGHPPSEVHFVGSSRGIESRLVPAAGFPLTLLPGRGIARRLSVANVRAVWGLVRAVARAFALLARGRPRVVVSVGGYASVPCAVAAATLRVPIIVHEQNAVPGAANRLAGRFARACAVSYPGTSLPRARVTGNPVRPEILAVERTAEARRTARQALGLEQDRWVVAAFGGSLGSLRINQAVLGALGQWADRGDLAVRHVVGERDWQLVTDALAGLRGPNAVAGLRGPNALDGLRDPNAVESLPVPAPGALRYQPVRYEDRMDLLFAAADLCVCRAGGNTVAELAVVGLPAVLVPLPNAPGDHQAANARVFERAGAAVLVPDGQLDGDRLVAEVDKLLADPGRLAAMGAAASGLARPDAADAVAALAEEHAGG